MSTSVQTSQGPPAVNSDMCALGPARILYACLFWCFNIREDITWFIPGEIVAHQLQYKVGKEQWHKCKHVNKQYNIQKVPVGTSCPDLGTRSGTLWRCPGPPWWTWWWSGSQCSGEETHLGGGVRRKHKGNSAISQEPYPYIWWNIHASVMHLSIHLFIYPFIHPSICALINLCIIHPSINLSINPSIHSFNQPYINPSIPYTIYHPSIQSFIR